MWSSFGKPRMMHNQHTQSLESKYTKIDTDQPLVAHTIKASLTPALGIVALASHDFELG